MQKKLSWLTEAFKHNNLREIRGRRHNKTILRWLHDLNAWWSNDETPWCGVFVAHCLQKSNRKIPKHWYRAKAYKNYGTSLYRPAYGCVGVMGRKGGGHVCFIVGQTSKGDLVGYGGNQGNAVNLSLFPKARFIAFVWPEGPNGEKRNPYKSRFKLPIYNSKTLKISKNEA